MKKIKKFKIALGIASLILIMLCAILFICLPYSQIHIIITFIFLTMSSLIAFLVLYHIDSRQNEIEDLSDNEIMDKDEGKQNLENATEMIEKQYSAQVPAKPQIKSAEKYEEIKQPITITNNLQDEVLNRYNQITMNEYVESTSAKKLYNEKKKQTLWILFLPAIPFILFIILFSIKFNKLEDMSTYVTISNVSLISLIISGIMVVLCPIIRNAFLSKYKIIYMTAKKNDEVRYNEKIRFMERKRLEEQYDNENSDTNILKTINGVGETVDD